MGQCLEETGWIRRGETGRTRSYTPLLLHQTEKRHRVPANVLHGMFLLDVQRSNQLQTADPVRTASSSHHGDRTPSGGGSAGKTPTSPTRLLDQ